MAQTTNGQHLDVGGLGLPTNGKIVWGPNDEVVLNATSGMVQVTTGVVKHAYDAAAYWTATQANAGGVTFASVSDGTAGFTFSQPVTFSSTVQQQGQGIVLNTRHVVTTAEMNAGHEILPAVSGLKYRLINLMVTPIGGAAAATANATGIAVYGTQSTSVVALYSALLAALTDDAVCTINTANTSVLTEGASFAACDANNAITVKTTTTGNFDLITTTHFHINLTYVLEA